MYMFQTNTLHRMLLEIGYTPEAPLHTGHTCCRVRCGRAFSSTKSHSPSLATTNARSRLASCARTEGRQLRPASAGGACAWMVECGICCGACEWYPRCGKARGLTTEINIMCSSWNAVLVNDSGKGYTVCYDKVPVSMCGRGSKQSINYPRGSQVHSEKVIGATNSYEKELEPGSILSKSWEHGVFKTKVNNSFVG